MPALVSEHNDLNLCFFSQRFVRDTANHSCLFYSFVNKNINFLLADDKDKADRSNASHTEQNLANFGNVGRDVVGRDKIGKSPRFNMEQEGI